MSKLKEIFTAWRVWVYILFVILAVVAISPKFGPTGVIIKNVEPNSSAAFNNVPENIIIRELNGGQVNNLDDYNRIIADIQPGEIVKITAKDGAYSFMAEGNETAALGIQVAAPPSSNIKFGLDIVGGVRILLKPEGEITQQQFDDLIEITNRRLNIYGLTDVSVRQTIDLEKTQYILVEIAAAGKEEITDIIAKQGKFEAKIANQTIFRGGLDIKQVCRSAECAGVRECNQVEGGWNCMFTFKVDVSPESAKKHGDITRNLTTILVGNNQYLSEKLDLYLDDELVESLYISADLKGQESTSFVIEGPGEGKTKDEAVNDALTSMKKMQTILVTGSLPVKLSIAKMDVISPLLGKEFFKYTIVALFSAIVATSCMIFFRYKKIKISISIMIICLSEILITIGIAALIKQNLDLAAIAGIIVAVGTGSNDQIVITDEVLAGEKEGSAYGWAEKLKRAFFIIMTCYLTIVAAMIPLWVMGAGLLKGFAIITIIGVSIGVFITRPAFAKIIEILLK